MNYKLALKLLIIGFVTIVISITLFMVNNTISERQQYRNDAIRSIEASSTGEQTIIGPVLVLPYKETTVAIEDGQNGTKKSVATTSSLTALYYPRTLDVRGSLAPNERRHGLYTVTAYEFAGHLKGSLDLAPPRTNGKVVYGEPYLAMSVEDVRGIVGTPQIVINGEPRTMLQGADAASGWKPNLRVPLPGLKEFKGQLDFSIDMNLAGTEQFSIAPIGDSNHVELTSPWHSPLFAGQFLPRTRDVSANGFSAVWDVSSLATSAQVQLRTDAGKSIDMLNVSLLTPIDPYKLSDRATKYGILFILLTFVGFFLFEMMKQLPIHPVQYLLVGFGLAIFFLLLISFSERIAFALAYLISSAACIGLLAFYLSFVLRSALRAIGFAAMLATLYAAVYGLLISEDNALILGSLLLFAVLAAVMVVTRKVDWYKTAPSGSTDSTPPQSPLPANGFNLRD